MDVLPTKTEVTTGGLRFALGNGSLGNVLVAVGDKGIPAILVGDHPSALRRDLANRFPEADLLADDAGLEDILRQVVALIDAPRSGLDVPLHIAGTEMERRVWQALGEIPVGSTSSYGEIAKKLGAPTTAQDVAAACAANQHAVAIPCHRVLKADGSISGYRWGVARKRALLAREASGG